MWMEAIRGAEDHETECQSCGGGVRRRPHGEMHAGSFVRDGARVEIRREPDAGFADPVVLDPLCQYFDGRLYRLWPQERYFARGGQRLHRDVWRAAFGPIPGGCHIHHRDGNTGNNRLANLECVPAAEHLRASAAKRTPVPFSAAARSAAAEWHRSDAGRAWHRRHAERAQGWTKWKREDRPCQHCGEIIRNALVRRGGNAQKYCTDTCKALAYRARNAAKRAG